jgi:hypothetical protein
VLGVLKLIKEISKVITSEAPIEKAINLIIEYLESTNGEFGLSKI